MDFLLVLSLLAFSFSISYLSPISLWQFANNILVELYQSILNTDNREYLLAGIKNYGKFRKRVAMITMQDLICSSYSKEQAIRFSRYKITQVDKETIAQAGRDILKNTPRLPYACALMSALWGAFIRDKTQIPAQVVAGNLSIHGRKIFYNNDSSDKVKQVFETSNYAWDGHVWVSFAGTIGDISIFRSAYSEPEDHWLHQLIVDEFGQGRGLLLGAPSSMAYEAKYVLTDNQITALIKSFDTMLPSIIICKNLICY